MSLGAEHYLEAGQRSTILHCTPSTSTAHSGPKPDIHSEKTSNSDAAGRILNDFLQLVLGNPIDRALKRIVGHPSIAEERIHQILKECPADEAEVLNRRKELKRAFEKVLRYSLLSMLSIHRFPY